MGFFLIQGCATRPPPEAFLDRGAPLEGKLSVRSAEERFSARFRWSQTGDRYRIELWGPLGQGRTILQGNTRQLSLLDGGGNLIDRGAPELVMLRHLGWTLPLDAFPNWILGQPLPGVPVLQDERDERGRPLGFRQLDWVLRFDRFSEAGEPQRLTAERGPYRVRVVL